jgi:hypothetical protein
MLYVPIIPPATVQPPSPRTRELAELLARVTEEYTKAHPATTEAEVRQALRMAEDRTRRDPTTYRRMVLLLVGVVVGLVAVGVLFLMRIGQG